MNYIVEIDKEKCIGCGSCSALAPDVFGLDSESNTAFVKEGADLSNLDLLLSVAESCPSGGIVVKDQEGNVLSKQE